MRKWHERLAILLILLAAAALRLTGIDWDAYNHYHPDERFITWAATTIEWPDHWRTGVDPRLSALNPFYWPPDAASDGIEVPQDERRNFAYGHFPLYVGVAATRLVEAVGPVLAPLLPAEWLLTRDLLNTRGMVEYRHLTAVARALTALMDTGTVLLVFWLGRRLFGTAVGLLAAAFLAVNVMHIQLAHFFAFDPYMTYFVVAAVLCMVVVVQGSRGAGEQGGRETDYGTGVTSYGKPIPVHRSRITVYWLLAAVCVGLAVGSKFAAVLLLLPLAVTAWLAWPQDWARWGAVAGATAVFTFLLTNPFTVLDLTCDVITPQVELGPVTIPALDWGSCFLANVSTQGAMVRGETAPAFVQQYNGTRPYLYFIEMQLRWGMGPLLGLVAFVGFGWVIWLVLRGVWHAWRHGGAEAQPGTEHGTENTENGLLITVHRLPKTVLSLLVVLAWCVPFFVVTGGFQVKFMRYLQPLTPFLMIFGAALLWQLPWRRLKWGATTAVLAVTALYALSFVNMYRQPHPWVAASEWVFANVPRGTLLLSEQWDDSLPTSMVFDGRYRRRTEYPNAELTWLSQRGSRDDEEKLMGNLALLAQAEYVTILSNRIYGVTPRLPEIYPISGQYPQLLFDGSLGYEPVFVAYRAPQLGGIALQPETFAWPGLPPPPLVADALAQSPRIVWGRVDESFTVYDQPLTIIFQNTDNLSAAEMRALFDVPADE